MWGYGGDRRGTKQHLITHDSFPEMIGDISWSTTESKREGTSWALVTAHKAAVIAELEASRAEEKSRACVSAGLRPVIQSGFQNVLI